MTILIEVLVDEDTTTAEIEHDIMRSIKNESCLLWPSSIKHLEVADGDMNAAFGI